MLRIYIVEYETVPVGNLSHSFLLEMHKDKLNTDDYMFWRDNNLL